MDENLALDRLRPAGAGGYAALLGKGTAVPAERSEGQDTESLPTLSGDYLPHARPSYKPIPSLHCLLKDRSIENFQYGELTSRSRFLPSDPKSGGNMLVLRFVGLEATELRIAGRNLRTLFDYLTQHRIAWVAELAAERDFEANEGAVVTEITIRAVQQE